MGIHSEKEEFAPSIKMAENPLSESIPFKIFPIFLCNNNNKKILLFRINSKKHDTGGICALHNQLRRGNFNDCPLG